MQNEITKKDKKMKRFAAFIFCLAIFGVVVLASENNRDKNISPEFLAAKLEKECPEYKRKCGNNQEQFCRKYYQKCISNFDGVKVEGAKQVE
jgi:hypothetical protein